MDVTSLKILDAKMSIHGLAYVVGRVPPARVREWIYSYRVIGSGPSSARGKGKGGPRVYSFAEAMALAAARALEEDVPLSVRNAAAAVAGDGDLIVKQLLAGREMLCATYAQARAARAVVTIRPAAIYAEMRPRLASLFPEETAELDRFLASVPPAPAGSRGDLGAAVDRMERFSLANATWTNTGAAAEGRE